MWSRDTVSSAVKTSVVPPKSILIEKSFCCCVLRCIKILKPYSLCVYCEKYFKELQVEFKNARVSGNVGLRPHSQWEVFNWLSSGDFHWIKIGLLSWEWQSLECQQYLQLKCIPINNGKTCLQAIFAFDLEIWEIWKRVIGRWFLAF